MSCDCNTLVVGEAGAPGPQGLAGINGTNGTNGINAFTTTSASFVQPAVNDPITFSVVENRWIAIGQTIYISNAGFYRVTALGSNPYTPVTATLVKTDGVVNPSSVNSGSKVSPSSVATLTSSLPSLTVTGNSLLDGAVTINDSGASVDFRVETDSQTHALYAKGSTNTIGICNSAPVATLDVTGTFKASQTAEFVLGATVNSSQANADFIVKTQGATDTLYVDASASRVGIGTSGPAKLLDVNGSAQAVTLLVNPAGLSDASSFKVLGASSGVPLNVDSTNNRVGIKTTSPSVELDVVGAAKISGDLAVDTNVLKVDTTGNFVGINITTPTVALDVVGAAKISGDLAVDTNVLKVDTTGNFVGINKTTPTVALDVVGALAVSTAATVGTTLGVSGATTLSSTLAAGASTLASLSVTGAAAVGTTLGVTGASTLTGDVTVGSNALVVKATGLKVGIKTATPATELDVVGSVQATDYRVSTGSGAAKLTQFYIATGSSHAISALAPGVSESFNDTPTCLPGDFVTASYATTPSIGGDFLNEVVFSCHIIGTNSVRVIVTNTDALSTTTTYSGAVQFSYLVTRAVPS